MFHHSYVHNGTTWLGWVADVLGEDTGQKGKGKWMMGSQVITTSSFSGIESCQRQWTLGNEGRQGDTSYCTLAIAGQLSTELMLTS